MHDKVEETSKLFNSSELKIRSNLLDYTVSISPTPPKCLNYIKFDNELPNDFMTKRS